ncbi:MAG: sodium-dependent transporter [Clostridia bacterium]|nr:sodium-dependent transporter [Clostridia bacterium]
MKREKLGSRLGFILLSAGCAIGVGNVWKFPYITGQYGGGAFVLIYLIFLAILGIPVLTMEFSLGRASQKSPVHMYQQLEKPGHKWHIHGYFAMAGNYLLMMFYTSVAGWMLQYVFYMISGKFEGKSSEQITGVFNTMLGQPWILLIFLVVVIILGFAVCALGVQKGIEKISKYMMLALLAIMIVLAIRSIFLPGGAEGLKFYLVPNFGKMFADGFSGFLKVVVAAMNQAFFTLSLGIGSMAIFGSYLGKDRALMGEAVNVTVLDTFVAITAGLIIFPACFAYDIDTTAGPPLIFQTLPNVFANMPGGRIFGTFFFVFMCFAAFTTVIAVFENIISMCMDKFGWSRKKSCLINCIAMLFLALPCMLGANILLFHPFGETINGVLDIEDYIVSNILLPSGALIMVLFCNFKFGWGFDKFKEEANTGKGLKVANWMKYYFRYVLPIIIGVILVYGIISPFI